MRFSDTFFVENSDLFDVLAHVAYVLCLIDPQSKSDLLQNLLQSVNPCSFQQQTAGLSRFCAGHYVQVGGDELVKEKLRPLLRIKYQGAIADAVVDLGRPQEIGKAIADFQIYLYQQPQ